MRFTTISLVGLLFLMVTTTASAAGGIPWVYDLGEAQQMAQRDQRLLLIHFYADWCGPCRSLEQSVFPDPNVGRTLAARYVPVKINIDKNQELAKRYGVTQIPMDVIADPQGHVLRQANSPSNPIQYVQLLNSLAASGAAGAPMHAVSAQVPPQNNQTASTPQAAWNSPWLEQGQDSGAVSSYRPQLPAATGYDGTAARQDPSGQVAPLNSHAEQAGRQDAWGQSSWQPNRTSSAWQYGGTGTTEEAAPVLNRSQPTPGGQVNPYVQHGTAPVAPPANPNLSSGPPLALDGYCPVTLAEEEKWEKGNPAWGALHRGRTYLFNGQQQQQLFLADPDRYSPVLSGYDSTRYVDAGEPVPGLRQHGMWFRGKIYLFADEGSLDQFARNPEHYAQRSHEIMTMAGR